MARAQFRGRGPRRKTQWGGFGNFDGAANLPHFVNLLAGAPAIVSQAVIAAGTSGLVDEEFTITRMIGRWTTHIAVNTAAAEATVAIGCLVTYAEAIAAGVASLPSVEDDPDSEWLYYGTMHLINPNSTVRDGPASAGSIDFDVRSQRIVKRGMSVVWIAESETSAVDLGVGGRYLVKLT